MPKPETSRNLYRYDIRLLNANLNTLVGTYDDFEERLIADLFNVIVQHFESSGAVPCGDILEIGGEKYKLSIDSLTYERILNIYLFPLRSSSDVLLDSEGDVSHIGRIRKICLRWPEAIKHKHESLSQHLCQQVLNAYKALQVVFTSRYIELEKRLLRNLYDLLNISILQVDKPHLLSRSWFTITDVTTNQFRYFFSHERFDNLLKVLIDHQVPERSPFELMICLLTDEATDTFWKMKVPMKEEFNSLAFVKLESVIENYDHWVAEAVLYQDPNLSVREIDLYSHQLLLINCPTQFVGELNPIIEFVRGDLAQQFRKNLSDYRDYKKLISKMAEPTKQSIVYRNVREFASDVISKTVAEIIRPRLIP